MAKCVDCQKLTMRRHGRYIKTEGKDHDDKSPEGKDHRDKGPEWRAFEDENHLTFVPKGKPFYFCFGLKKPLGLRWNINKERKCKHYRPKRLIAETMLRTGL